MGTQNVGKFIHFSMISNFFLDHKFEKLFFTTWSCGYSKCKEFHADSITANYTYDWSLSSVFSSLKCTPLNNTSLILIPPQLTLILIFRIHSYFKIGQREHCQTKVKRSQQRSTRQTLTSENRLRPYTNYHNSFDAYEAPRRRNV